MSEELIVQIEWSHYCVGVVCNDEGIVIEAAPAIKWAIGLDIEQVLKWKKIERYRIVN